MKHVFTFIICGLLFLNSCSYKSNTHGKAYRKGGEKSEEKLKEEEKEREERNELEESKNKYDHALELQEWEFHITQDPATHSVPKQRVLDAMEFEKNRKANLPEAAISGITWKERGPSNVGGRTRAMMLDPNDLSKKTLWAGSVSGGLWKTTDITATTPVWTCINDLFANLAITSLAYDSTNNDTMYFGTGEGWFNLDAVQGFGIWRTVDKGVNWSQLASTTGSSFNFINRIVVHPTNHKVYVATRTGIYLSTDFGGTFNLIGYSGQNVSDIELASNGRIHIGIGSRISTREYHYTDNDGVAWDLSAHNFNTVVAGTGRRVELAIAPSNGNILYALVSTASALEGIYKSTNAGITWSATNAAAWEDLNCGSTSPDFTRNQSWYDLTLAVNPTDASRVIIGGVDLLRTSNGGSSWSQISSWWAGCSRQYVHADQHLVYFEPGSATVAYFANDGGIYRTTNANAATPTIVNKNGNYNVTQLYSTTIHPQAYRNFFIGGSQDNGSLAVQSSGIGNGTEVSGGDGGFCHFETDEPAYAYSSYVYNNFYRSTDTGQTFSQVIAFNKGPFITPWDFDNTNNIMYASYNTDTVIRYSNMHAAIGAALIPLAVGAGMVTHVKVSPNTPTTVYFGTDAKKVFKVTTANGSPSISNITGASFPSGTVSCIEVQKGNENHLLVTFSNYGVNSVWESTNAGGNWTSVEGNLPDLPVRWAIFSPINSSHAMIATETGVYSTDLLNSGSTNWGINSTGMPNVRVDMLKVRASDSLVIAATHGRGLFTTDWCTTAQANFGVSTSLTYLYQPIQFSDDSYKATTWAWDFDNNGSTDATIPNPTWAYGTPGIKTAKLTINAGTTPLIKTVSIQILPNRAIPYTTAQGGDFESNASDFGSKIVSGITNLWERGTPGNYLNSPFSGSNVWKTKLNTDIPEGDYKCVLQTPNFNFFAAGTYTISFRMAMEVVYTNAPMAVWMEYSTNFGTSWTRLGSNVGNPSGTSNWYQTNSHNVSPDGMSWAFTSGTGSTWLSAAYNASALAGNKNVTFRFVALTQPGWGGVPDPYAMDGFSIDNFAISGPANAVNSSVETTAVSKSEVFGPSATVDFYSPNGKILATLTNNSAHNYGLTTVSIDNAGTGAVNYSTNTANALKIFQKSLQIVPTNNNGSGNYTIKLYFDATEISGWKAITGINFNNSNIIKCPGNIASGTHNNGVYGTSQTIAAYGAFDSSITATFSTGFSGFGGGNNSGVLPVTLVNFTALKKENNVELNWLTSSEINNMGFDLERSIDGKNWNKIYFAPGRGTYFSRTNYSFTDENAFEAGKVLFYRLKQQDFNGVFEYSTVRVVEKSIETENITFSPQPAVNELLIETSLTLGFNYTIINQEGKEVANGKITSASGKINIAALPPGNYYLRVMENNELYSTKMFVKIN
jgi:hypothetical protein